jgi:hypothetical protein
VWKLLGAIAFVSFVSVGCGSGDENGGDAEQRESTRAVTTTPSTPFPPPAPTPIPYPVLAGAGDIASCTQDDDVETAALLDAVVSGAAGEVVVFTTGDNVYEYGTREEFEQCYHSTWGRHKDRTRPAPGNHDYGTAGAEGYFGYFGAAAGEPGRGYYSYDLGAWHIVVLNTSDHCQSILCSPGSPQEAWLRTDLASNSSLCTVAIWHDPLFSSGRVHGGNRYVQPFWDVLYEYGADVVLNGHEHNYERFAPQTPTGEADAAHGIRQIIVGTGGESHYFQGELLPNSEAADGKTYGVLKLTLRPAGYDWEFIPLKAEQFSDSGRGQCHGPPGSP